MPKQTTIPPTSIRQGKLQPSSRYENPEAKTKAMRTNWRLGIDSATFESTYSASSKQAGNVPPEVLALRAPRINKNSSDKAGILQQGGRYAEPSVIYNSTYKSDHNPSASVFSSDFVKGKPAFDRLSANKTNYDLATSSSHYDLQSTSHAHHTNPENWEVRRGFEQPSIGGWSNSKGDYCVDEASRGSVVRGGGGGEGSLGVRFNVVTNQTRPDERSNVALRTGPRVSYNMKDPWRKGADSFGEQSGGSINIISGKLQATPVAPQRPSAKDLLRPDQSVLRSQPW